MSKTFALSLAILLASASAFAGTSSTTTDNQGLTWFEAKANGDERLDFTGGATYSGFASGSSYDHSKTYIRAETGFSGLRNTEISASNIRWDGGRMLMSAGAKLDTVILTNGKLHDGERVFKLNSNAENVARDPSLVVDGNITPDNQIQYEYDFRTGFDFAADPSHVFPQNAEVQRSDAAGDAYIGKLTLGGGGSIKTGFYKAVQDGSGFYTGQHNPLAYTGRIDNLSFGDKVLGNGTLNVTSIAQGPGNDAKTVFAGFNQLNVGTVDLAGANISVDLKLACYGLKLADRVNYSIDDLLAGGEIDLASFFAEGAVVTNASLLNSLTFVSGSDTVTLVSGGELDEDWYWSGTKAIFGEAPPTGGNSTPEPATLALVGLGLGGLALARRRKK